MKRLDDGIPTPRWRGRLAWLLLLLVFVPGAALVAGTIGMVSVPGIPDDLPLCERLKALKKKLAKTKSAGGRHFLKAQISYLDESEGINAGSCAMIAETELQLKKAEAGTPVTTTKKLVSTVGWGCPCPPFADVRALDGPSVPGRFLYALPVEGLLDPGDYYLTGVFEMKGHLTGESIDMLTWYERRGKKMKLPADGKEYWLALHPVFVVESWCLTPPKSAADKQLYQQLSEGLDPALIPVCPKKAKPKKAKAAAPDKAP